MRELAWAVTAILAAGMASAGQIPSGVLTIGAQPPLQTVRFTEAASGDVRICVEQSAGERCCSLRDLREWSER